MKKISVVAAVIQHNDLYLCVRRGPAKYDYIANKWEFPGGKVEPEETKEDAIKREIQEELKMEIMISTFLMTVSHVYPDFHLTMDTFLCNTFSKDLTLTEHQDFLWLPKDKLSHLDWAAADKPIVSKLESL
ncbi:(deoxy)nucleoside triphosphate pyrophosphohydrolase [Leptospira kemamanensis]|uniref:8-oxo-dGTP diphosphatase n=1 Tax=Leptospira kemamanensis TaxID=2484942 RepID=A0A4R9JXX8_9LEPT|nr:(deoxy)nucleoside triphosphate pyrophosphohydrolase [Leptospira kemamanensis]TGL57001.1 (deoxy)nucleoside triphosphate pyrophosphohydrolase [Leptospira kemamanensis]